MTVGMKGARRAARLRRIPVLALVFACSGCTMKYVDNRLEDDWFQTRRQMGGGRPPLAFGLSTDNIPIGFSGLALSLDYSSQNFDADVLPPLVEFESAGLSNWALAARFFPVDRGPVTPFVGGGFGRSKLSGTWTGPNYDVRIYECFGDCTDSYEEKFYSSFHPHVLGGLELRFTRSWSLIGEYRRDFNRNNDFWLMDGDSYAFGLRWRAGASLPR